MRAGHVNVQMNLESPSQKDVIKTIEALDSFLAGLYPPSSNHLVPVEALAGENVRFVVARLERKAVGCGALVLDQHSCREIKRMYVSPDNRGHGMGSGILRELERLAAEEHQESVRLETGIEQRAALRLNSKVGYARCALFGDYAED